ncbi:MAG: efflux RND transporter periplasmic adaptor subunit [Flammeovirgaceae bacterium]|nr:efflux RND transporter periplasmic adaptor subunit [Flammeovirgaceae bacterium]
MKTTKLISILSIIIGLALTMSCGSKTAEEAITEDHHQEEENTVEFTGAQYKTADIELGKVENKQISGTIKVNGKLDVPPQQMVSISVPLGGFLKTTSLLQGSRVKKGEVIATMENLDFIQMQQDYIEAKNQLEFAKADYDRQLDLAKENVNAQKTLQQAKTTYSSWQAKTKGLEAKLKMLNINLASLEGGNITSSINLYSPIDGYVTEVNVNIGKYVNPTDILFEIVDTEHLHAELTVFEKDVPKLKIGQKVRFTLANESKERIATVYLLGREISADRTIRIHCHIDKEDTNLLPGMYLKAVVETGGIQVAALPDKAIIDYQGKKYIFYQLSEQPHAALKEESKEQHEAEYHFTMLEVQTGNSEMGYTEVMLPSDFATETAQVVVKNAYAILSKMKNTEEEE